MTDLAAIQGDRWARPDQVERAERAGLGVVAAGPAVLAAPAGPVQAGVQPPAQSTAAVRVDGPVDALVADDATHAVGAPGEFDRDRHRRVLRLEPGRHVRGEHWVGLELGQLRPTPLRVRATLRGDGRVTVPAAVAVDLCVDRAAVPAKPVTDLSVGLAALDTGADLLAFGRGQGSSWHAGYLHRSGLCVDSGQHARHHALTGGTSSSTSRCCRHPLNSPSLGSSPSGSDLKKL